MSDTGRIEIREPNQEPPRPLVEMFCDIRDALPEGRLKGEFKRYLIATGIRAAFPLSRAGQHAEYVGGRDELNSPDFDRLDKSGDRYVNWRAHVPDEVRAMWHCLPLDARACIFLMAVRAADAYIMTLATIRTGGNR